MDVCQSPVARLSRAQTPCKCLQEDETSGLSRSTNTRLRESSPSFLMCRFHGARDAGSQVSLVSLPCLDSCLKAVGPFVFFGIVCLYVKCLCVLISCTLCAWLTQSFQAKLSCLPSFLHPASFQSFPLSLLLGMTVEIAYYYLASKNFASSWFYTLN